MTEDEMAEYRIRRASLDIIGKLSEWEAEAGQCAQAEQDYEAYERVLLVKISDAIRKRLKC